jgi:outer membrane protein OmpA-like peptidoglycan-associated protein
MGEITNKPRPKARVRALALGFAAAAALLAAAPAASAQTSRAVYLDRLFMAGAPEDTIGMWRPQMGEKTRFFGQAGLGFSYDAFRVENHIEDIKQRYAYTAPVKPQLITYLDVGVEILDRFAFQVELPVIVYQSGGKTSSPQFGGDSIGLKPVAPMDMRMDFRAILYRNDDRSFKLGAEAGVWVPTGNALSFGGDGGASGTLSLSAEINLKKVFFLVNTGPQFRPVGGFNDFSVANEWRYAGGAFIPMRDGAFRLGAQIFGSAGFGQKGAYTAPNTPLEWLAEMRIATDVRKRGWFSFGGGSRLTAGYAPDFRIVALAGYSFPIADTDPPSPGKRFKAERYKEHGADTDHDGIPDDIDLCPTDPEDGKPPNPDDGCPALPDRDGDGIPDNVDKCPDVPEDFDGIDDTDGCPEDDSDKDGIMDAQDACPKEPGEADPDPKKNGCPKFIRRITGSSEIQILKTIEFATGKSTILSKSFPILDEVVRLVKVNPDIQHLDIEGHTDNKGSDDLNEKLSNERAHSVMKYMVDKGIAEARLSAAGYGPKRPIADNNTADGRQRNRRVEFHIVNKVEPGKPGAPGGLAPGSNEGGHDAPTPPSDNDPPAPSP